MCVVVGGTLVIRYAWLVVVVLFFGDLTVRLGLVVSRDKFKFAIITHFRMRKGDNGYF